MKMVSYLSFDGRCEEAIGFYAKTLGGRVGDTMRWGKSPMAEHVSADWHDKIMHAEVSAGESTLMASDSPPGRFEPMRGMSVSLFLDTVAESERVFAAFAEGGSVSMPVAPTFWAASFGMVTDRFGTPWMVICLREG